MGNRARDRITTFSAKCLYISWMPLPGGVAVEQRTIRGLGVVNRSNRATGRMKICFRSAIPPFEYKEDVFLEREYPA